MRSGEQTGRRTTGLLTTGRRFLNNKDAKTQRVSYQKRKIESRKQKFDCREEAQKAQKNEGRKGGHPRKLGM